MDLWNISAIDQHAHNVLKPDVASRLPYPAAFTESHDPEVIARHARQTTCFRRSLRDVAALLNCDATEEAIVAERNRLGWQTLTARCFSAAKLDEVLLDDGFLPDDIMRLDWHEQFVPVRRLLRIERVAEQLLDGTESFDVFLERFRACLESPGQETVGFKSIIAYRSGLNVAPVTKENAEEAFRGLGEGNRLTDKRLLDFLYVQALEVAARCQLPMQLHTGFGDPDLDLRLANPLHLRRWLEDRRFRSVRIVLLHASYPYAREASYLASVYPQVYVDMGLAVPLLSIAGMKSVVGQLLELAPMTKVMYSSDAHFIPELFYLGAKWGREVLASVLEGAVREGDLTSVEADKTAVAILANNARALYSAEAM